MSSTCRALSARCSILGIVEHGDGRKVEPRACQFQVESRSLRQGGLQCRIEGRFEGPWAAQPAHKVGVGGACWIRNDCRRHVVVRAGTEDPKIDGAVPGPALGPNIWRTRALSKQPGGSRLELSYLNTCESKLVLAKPTLFLNKNKQILINIWNTVYSMRYFNHIFFMMSLSLPSVAT